MNYILRNGLVFMMIDLHKLADAVNAELEFWSNDIDEKCKAEVTNVAKDALNLLKNHPNIPVRTGKYKKGFRIKVSADGAGYRRMKIYNTKYQLTHLLEHGHVIAATGGRSKAYPHWRDAQDLIDTLPKRLEEVVGG